MRNDGVGGGYQDRSAVGLEWVLGCWMWNRQGHVDVLYGSVAVWNWMGLAFRDVSGVLGRYIGLSGYLCRLVGWVHD